MAHRQLRLLRQNGGQQQVEQVEQVEHRLVVATVSTWRQPGVSRLSIAFRLSVSGGQGRLSGFLEQLLGLPALLGIRDTSNLLLDLGMLLDQEERPAVAAWRELEGICSVIRAHIFMRPATIPEG